MSLTQPLRTVVITPPKKVAKKPVVVAKPVDPLLTQANTIVDAGLDPQKTAIQHAIDAAEASKIASAKATAGITDALGRLSAGDAAALRDTYADAGKSIAGYAQGFTGSLREIQQNAADAVNAHIASLGAPGAVHSTSADNANVTYQTGGNIPASTLAETAAGAMANSLAHRLAAGLRVADAGLSSQASQAVAIDATRQKLLDLEAQRPGLLATALNQVKQQDQQKRATDVQIGTLQLSQAKTKFDQALAMTNITGTVHIVKKGAVIDTGIPATGSDANRITQQGVQKEADRVAAAAKARADRIAAKNRADAANTTREETARIAAEARNHAADITKGNADIKKQKDRASAQTTFVTNANRYARSIIAVNKDLGRPLKMPPKKATLVRGIVNTYGNALVGTFGIKQSEVVQWANQVVNSFPNVWWDPAQYAHASAPGTGGGVTA